MSNSTFTVFRPATGGPFRAAWEGDVKSRDFPRGTELREFRGRRTFEATLVNSRIVRRMMGMLDVSVGEVARTVLAEVPSLTRPISNVVVEELHVTDGLNGAHFLAGIIDDERVLGERDAITDVLGRFIGPEVEWPELKIEMNLAYMLGYVQREQVRVVQGIVGSIFPTEVNLGPAVTLPRVK